MDQTVACMKWGTRYSAPYVNCLWSMIKRNTRRPTRLLCYSDDPTGVHSEITVLPIHSIALPTRVAHRPWRKISLWAADIPGISGDVLYIDLDVVITSSIDEFFDFHPGATFCVIENWTQIGSGIGNTSCYRFRVGAHSYIYDNLQRDPEAVLTKHTNSQTYISRTITEKVFWPTAWCQSFKHSLMPRWPLNFIAPAKLPPEAKVIAFTGKPDIDEARDGWSDPRWSKKLYKYVRPTPWIAAHWR